MIISLRKWWERAKFVALFILFTFLVYHLHHAVTSWMTPHHRFSEPTGQAVKVDAPSGKDHDDATIGERLRIFYWYGE